MCVCAHARLCTTARMWTTCRSHNSLHLVRLRDRTQVVTFDRCPYLTLSHFTDLNFLLLRQPHCVWTARNSQSSYLSLTNGLQFYCNCLFILCLYVGIMLRLLDLVLSTFSPQPSCQLLVLEVLELKDLEEEF